MEKCIVTGKLLPYDKLIDTAEGFVAAFVWGKKEIKTDGTGLALLPIEWLPKLRQNLGRDPLPDSLEDGGECLKADCPSCEARHP